MDTVYIETSIVSYASAWSSREIQTAALQQQARDWWEFERPKFDLVTSQVTLNEASAGDPTAAADRMKLLEGIPLINVGADAQSLAARLIDAHTMPKKAAADALHVAAAALAGVKYFLYFAWLRMSGLGRGEYTVRFQIDYAACRTTLNCKHIANAHELPRIYQLLRDGGYDQLLICTPSEFLGGDDDDDEQSNP